jgi:signal peptidase II
VQKRGTVATLNGNLPSPPDDRVSPVDPLRRFVVVIAVAATVVGADQLTKSWAIDRLSRGPIHVIGTLDLELTRNSGSAFSLFEGRSVALVVVGLVLLGGLLAMAWRASSLRRVAILGLIIGGAIGNLTDRLVRNEHGAVVDFIALHFWPTFNVADSCIVVGCLLLAFSLLRTAPR